MTRDVPFFIGSEVFRTKDQRSGHPLAVPRVSLAMDLCRSLGWLNESNFVDSPRATKADLVDFHSSDYIDAVVSAEKSGEINALQAQRYNIGVNGNPIFKGMYSRPATACGGGLWAAERLSANGGVFYNIGGGQHHSWPNRASGFCYFNEPVLSIRALLNQGIERVFYLDLDAHQGDAVQAAFSKEPRVFTLSIHEFGRWPMTRNSRPGAFGTSEDGGPAHRNLAVMPGFNDTELEYVMDVAVLPLLQAFQPQVVYCQCGCDALADDPQSKLKLSNTAIWRSIAMIRDNIPDLLVSGGGGYNPYAVGRCWSGVWATLNGFDIPDHLPEPAKALMAEIKWRHRLGRSPSPHWLSTLADSPRPGPIRNDTKELIRKSFMI